MRLDEVFAIYWRDIGPEQRREQVTRWIVRWGEAVAARYKEKR